MSLASGHKGRPGSIMDKKIHENPKYRGVTSRLNTGSSLSKYNKKVCDLIHLLHIHYPYYTNSYYFIKL